LARFAVFGSFVTDKAEPNDVDIVLIMEDAFSNHFLCLTSSGTIEMWSFGGRR